MFNVIHYVKDNSYEPKNLIELQIEDKHYGLVETFMNPELSHYAVLAHSTDITHVEFKKLILKIKRAAFKQLVKLGVLNKFSFKNHFVFVRPNLNYSDRKYLIRFDDGAYGYIDDGENTFRRFAHAVKSGCENDTYAGRVLQIDNRMGVLSYKKDILTNKDIVQKQYFTVLNYFNGCL